MKIITLTSAEEQFMKFFWKMNSFYMKEVMELHPEPKPHQNTVSTYLKILQEKGFLSTKKEGRINKYNVSISFEDYRNFLLNNFLRNYYQNSTTELLRDLAEKKLIKFEQIQDFDKTSFTEIPTKKKLTEESSVISEFVKEITSLKKEKKIKKDKKKKKKK